MASELGRDFFPGFTDAASKALHVHRWPGNLRELKNVVERAVYRAEPDEPVDEVVLDPFQSPFRPVEGGNAPHAGMQLPLDIKSTIRELEVGLVNRAMATGKFNQRRAAELLGLTYHQFRGYLKKYDDERRREAQDG